MLGGNKLVTAMSLISLVLLLSGIGQAEGGRKIKHQVQPAVPPIARQMGLSGTVRLEIQIAADGTVKSAKPLGGHPLLIQSAEDAVRKWRYEPGTPSKEIVEFNFQQAN